jgi:serine/threonine protein kinase
MNKTEAPVTRRSASYPADSAPVDLAGGRESGAIGSSGWQPPGIPERFEVVSEIGRGGMGIVYKARDVETDEIIALKLLKPEVASDPRMREDLRQEVCLARRVTHKNVCRIHEFHRSTVASCISMEFVNGETLLSKLQRDGALSSGGSIRIARQICAGLREAHARGIIHRDLKPANIMIDQYGVVKIMDFGIARHALGSGHLTQTIAGTPEYMAPEQIELRPIGPRTDIYSLGLLLYEMVTGSSAFSGDNSIAIALKQLRESPERPSRLVSTVSPGFEAIILKCLRKNPESRFQSVDHLDTSLAKVLANGASTGPAASIGINPIAIAKQGLDKWFIVRPHLVRYSLALKHIADYLIQTQYRDSMKWFNRPMVSRPGQALPKNRLVSITAVAIATLLGIGVIALVANEHVDRNIANAETQPSEAAKDLKPAVPPVLALSSEPIATGGAAENAMPQDSERVGDTNLGSNVSPTGDSSGTPPPSDASLQLYQSKTKTSKLRAESAPSAARNKAANKKVQVSTAAARPSSADQSASLVEGSAGTIAVTTPQPVIATAAASSSPETAAGTLSSTIETYLEVGTFKDAAWADRAVEKLTELGFHAVCVHKTILWKLQSYHVEVGPYTTSEDVQGAQKHLTEQGFRSHVIK